MMVPDAVGMPHSQDHITVFRSKERNVESTKKLVLKPNGRIDPSPGMETCKNCQHWHEVELPKSRGILIQEKVEAHGLCLRVPPAMVTIGPGQFIPQYPMNAQGTIACAMFESRAADGPQSKLAAAHCRAERAEAKLDFALEQVGNVVLASGETVRQAVEKIG